MTLKLVHVMKIRENDLYDLYWDLICPTCEIFRRSGGEVTAKAEAAFMLPGHVVAIGHVLQTSQGKRPWYG